MTKKEVQERVLQYGKKLALSKFKWGEGTNTFASEEYGLVIDFSGIGNCTFSTGGCCTFRACYNCTFKTGPGCIFNTGDSCTFNTGRNCAFITGNRCTFTTVYQCIFHTGYDCTWVTEGKSYPFAPLFIQGGKWSVNVYRPGYLKIGCKEHTFKEWTWCAMRVAADEGVSQETLKEYICLTKVAREWAKQKGWLTPK